MPAWGEVPEIRALRWCRLPCLPAVIGAAAMFLVGCSVSNLDLVNDHRLHFLQPADRAHLRLPVVLRWTMAGSAPASSGPTGAAGAGRYFAIFVDQAPVRPGQTLAAVASGDRSCRRSDGCPNALYLSARQVYMTSAESFVLDHVDSIPNARQKEQLHEVTVVLVDGTGRRIGESAWYRDFWLPRAGFG